MKKGNLIIYKTPDWLTAFSTGRDSGVEALGLTLVELALPRQVHSDNVLWMHEAGRPEATDAVITDRPGLCVCVKTADCIPVLLYDTKQRLVAAVHAGWRGTVSRIVQKTIKQMHEYVDEGKKVEAVLSCLSAKRTESETGSNDSYSGLKKVIIFAGKKQRVKDLTRTLRSLSIDARAMHSDLEQNERDQVMLDFRNGKIDVLVATDVVARGIDVTDVPLVINYDVPHDPEDYVHRIGRTARAENSGEALTLIAPDDVHYWKRIERFLAPNGHDKSLRGDESSTRSGKGCSGGSRHSSRNRGGHPHRSKGRGRGGHRRASKPQS